MKSIGDWNLNIQLRKVFFFHIKVFSKFSRYADRDDYYEDRDDDIGYDRQGSDVGYMSRHDDFPTVVW